MCVQVEEEKQEKGSDPTMDADYLEPDIDSIRAIKNQVQPNQNHEPLHARFSVHFANAGAGEISERL